MRIHETAWVAPSADVMGDVTLEERSSVWYGCVLRGDIGPIVVGPGTNIQDLSVVHVLEDAGCTIGADVGVGHRVVLHACTVEDGCLIGMGSVILDRARIGAGSVVGAGAVVPEGMQVPPGSLVLGVPAKVVRTVDETLRARIRMTAEHYVELARKHREGRYPLHRP